MPLPLSHVSSSARLPSRVWMPQMKDFETLVCGGGADTKVACETQIEAPQLPPPESMVERVGSGRDLFWGEVGGGAVYERDDSTKGNTNPKAQAQQQQHAKPNYKPRSSSQRLSGGLQSKPPIIGIPGEIQHHSGYLGRSVRRPANGRIFPKKLPRPGGDGGGRRKSAVPDEDPGSPKVSCIGKVLSERERDRCRRQRRLSPSEEEEKVGRVESSGCWASLSAVICCGDGERQAGSVTRQTTKGDSPAKTAAERRTTGEPAMEPPGLAAMKRFASVRRPESWGMDLRPLDREAAECGRRRSVGSLEDAQLEWLADGSASV